MNECPICSRPSHDDETLCPYHQLALENLRDASDVWADAMDLDWNSYLDYVYAVDGVGNWVREVIAHIRSENGSLE
jgi:hypothetical protein